MTAAQIDSKERLHALWGNVMGMAVAAGAAGVIAPESTSTPEHADLSKRRPPGVLRLALRIVRNAAIGLALITAVPLSVVAVYGNGIMLSDVAAMSEGLEDAERMRSLALPKDATIDALQAGETFQRLSSAKASAAFPQREVGDQFERPWKGVSLAADVFKVRENGFNGPHANTIITLAARGLSAEELAFLELVAKAPLWNEFDRIAQAPSIDRLGARYQLPFNENASSVMLPAPAFADSRELAYAGLARAAYHVSRGEHERAEHALRSVVSFGFAYIDNANSAIDALVGKVIVETGRSGMRQYTAATGRALGSEEALAIRPSSKRSTTRGSNADPDLLRQRMIERVADPATPRGLRMESLERLAFGSCSSVRGVVFGHSAEVETAFADASQSLARFESERQLIGLMKESTDRIPAYFPKPVVQRLATGAAEIAGTIFNNPRIAGCTRIAFELGRRNR